MTWTREEVAARAAKEALSGAPEAVLTLVLPDGRTLDATLTRADFAALGAPLIARTVAATRRALGAQLNDRWWNAYRANRDNRYELNPEAKGRRRLKNVALGYLVANAEETAVSTTFEQFGEADNMTDRLAALGLLTSLDVSERKSALAAFHARYKHDPLVLDKWFATQALSTHPDALDQVIALSRHADFSRTNPNRFRALIGSFGANQPRFHAADGGGYRFLADEVLAVDGLNSQSAARMVQPLTRWRRFGADRAALMRAELERIMATPGLSKDVFEVVSKGLS